MSQILVTLTHQILTQTIHHDAAANGSASVPAIHRPVEDLRAKK